MTAPCASRWVVVPHHTKPQLRLAPTWALVPSPLAAMRLSRDSMGTMPAAFSARTMLPSILIFASCLAVALNSPKSHVPLR
jgi:hypothetical protein